MNKRSISIILLTLFIGTFFGTLLGEILAWILPQSVVRDFFLKSVDLKYVFILCICRNYRIEIKTINQFGHKESQSPPTRPVS